MQDREHFDQLVLPHLRAAFNLARWLLRSREDAEDVTQEALLRAFRFFSGFHGSDARAWLLQIVRDTCYTWMEKNRPMNSAVEFDESLHLSPLPGPEAQALAGSERERPVSVLRQSARSDREVRGSRLDLRRSSPTQLVETLDRREGLRNPFQNRLGY